MVWLDTSALHDCHSLLLSSIKGLGRNFGMWIHDLKYL